MKHLNRLLITFCLIAHVTTIQAQKTIPATGGNASGAGGSASYSVGQVAYTTNTGTNASVAQGVQQPYEISNITGIEEALGIILECSIYPNPTNGKLNIELIATEQTDIQFTLTDITGQTVIKGIYTFGLGVTTKNIDLPELSNGLYILKLQTDKNYYSEKIIIEK